MRKTLCLVFGLVFALGVLVGYGPTDAIAKGGGGGTGCYYTCDCAGTPLRCCPTAFGTFCSPTEDFACTQVYNC
jgi:hypothetical protein